jgi:hypothetical protein
MSSSEISRPYLDGSYVDQHQYNTLERSFSDSKLHVHCKGFQEGSLPTLPTKCSSVVSDFLPRVMPPSKIETKKRSAGTVLTSRENMQIMEEKERKKRKETQDKELRKKIREEKAEMKKKNQEAKRKGKNVNNKGKLYTIMMPVNNQNRLFRF